MWNYKKTGQSRAVPSRRQRPCHQIWQSKTGALVQHCRLPKHMDHHCEGYDARGRRDLAQFIVRIKVEVRRAWRSDEPLRLFTLHNANPCRNTCFPTVFLFPVWWFLCKMPSSLSEKIEELRTCVLINWCELSNKLWAAIYGMLGKRRRRYPVCHPGDGCWHPFQTCCCHHVKFQNFGSVDLVPQAFN